MWQHVLEPFMIFNVSLSSSKMPEKYSGPWNFGTERNTITSVEQIIEKIIFY